MTERPTPPIEETITQKDTQEVLTQDTVERIVSETRKRIQNCKTFEELNLILDWADTLQPRVQNLGPIYAEVKFTIRDLISKVNERHGVTGRSVYSEYLHRDHYVADQYERAVYAPELGITPDSFFIIDPMQEAKISDKEAYQAEFLSLEKLLLHLSKSAREIAAKPSFAKLAQTANA